MKGRRKVPEANDMSLRDYFAGQAMRAHYQEQIALKIREGPPNADSATRLTDRRLAVIAECSYKMTDAMLKAREAKGGGDEYRT